MQYEFKRFIADFAEESVEVDNWLYMKDEKVDWVDWGFKPE